MLLPGLDRSVRGASAGCLGGSASTAATSAGRGTEPALDVGQPVADHRQLLAQVGVALLELLLVGVGVLLDEHRGHRGRQHADEADSHQHEDHGDGPATRR